jgi:hypothetical protein
MASQGPGDGGGERPARQDGGRVPPGVGPGWVKLRGNQGWRDPQGNLWKIDRLHKDHWDVSDPKGNKIREIDFNGHQIWPGGAKNRGKRTP